MTNAIAATIAALAEHEAPLYLSGGYYRVALTGPDGEPRLPGLTRARITITANYVDDGAAVVDGVNLFAAFPDGEQEDGPTAAGPAEAVAYWRACQEHARDIYRATAREERIRRNAATVTSGRWEPGEWSRDDPRDPVPYDEATLTLPGGTRLTRTPAGGDVPTWKWGVQGRTRYADEAALAALADGGDAYDDAPLPATIAAGPSGEDTRRQRMDDPLTAAVADAIAAALGDERPAWERALLRESGDPAEPTTVEEAVARGLDADNAGRIQITVCEADDAGTQWVPCISGQPLPAHLTGTMPAWAGPARVRAWLAIILGERAAEAAVLSCCGVD